MAQVCLSHEWVMVDPEFRNFQIIDWLWWFFFFFFFFFLLCLNWCTTDLLLPLHSLLCRIWQQRRPTITFQSATDPRQARSISKLPELKGQVPFLFIFVAVRVNGNDAVNDIIFCAHRSCVHCDFLCIISLFVYPTYVGIWIFDWGFMGSDCSSLFTKSKETALTDCWWCHIY